MPPAPRILLSIDYEPWFALTRRYDRLSDPEERRALDAGFSEQALQPILELLGPARASFYLVGEIAGWYPDVPQKISASGHELGFHCHLHRSLVKTAELEYDLDASAAWIKHYNVRAYRAPMIGIDESAYAMLAGRGFRYSSSTYAPAGTLQQKNGLWELPVSTLPLLGHPQPAALGAPRNFTLKLLSGGELPYGSSFTIGMLPDLVMRIIEKQLCAGLSPVIFLHPYELFPPQAFLRRMTRDLLMNPLLFPFTLNKTPFLTTLLKNFPVSPLGAYLDEVLNA